MSLKKLKYLFLALCISFVFTGCSYLPSISEESENTWENSGYVTVGNTLTIQNTNDRLNLISNMDALSADGLYYASWAAGSPEAIQNSDGDTIHAYDAQLYLLLGEFPDSQSAKDAMDQWLAAGKANYEVLSEEEIICSGQSYSLITYNCTHDGNPYDCGISAFGMYHNSAVCIELTGRENDREDLKNILNEFLNNCNYNGQ